MDAQRLMTGRLRIWVGIAAIWALVYAAYRSYYALGGTLALPGTLLPDARATFQLINAVAVVVLLVGVAAPVVMLRLWTTRLRPACIAVCSAVTVGCVMHAIIDMTQRVLSLLGQFSVSYPTVLWASVDRRAADLQDLFGNEPWFLIEGLLFATLAMLNLSPCGRRVFVVTAAVAIAAFVAVGLLTATGRLERVIVS